MAMSLEEWRKELEWLDRMVVELLNKRMKIVEDIYVFKKKQNLSLQDLEREKKILNQVEEMAEHPVLKETIKNIFQPIMESAKTLGVMKMQSDCPFRRIGLLGFGLMGGSIVKIIKAKDPGVSVYTLKHDCIDMELASQKGFLDGI